MRVHM